MAVELKVADCTQRLADQLQTLSEVAETLTFRLLELEERLAAQELKVQSLLEDHPLLHTSRRCNQDKQNLQFLTLRHENQLFPICQ